MSYEHIAYQHFGSNHSSSAELSPQTADYPLICIIDYRIF